MKRDWQYAYNAFEIYTRNSYRKFLSLTVSHTARIKAAQADADIAPLVESYEPMDLAFRELYSHWMSAKGARKGKTLSLEQVFDTMPQQLRLWEGKIRFIYMEGTAAERALFPKARSVFEQGDYYSRISAVGVLYKLLEKETDHPSLLELSTQVQSFYNLAQGARHAQVAEKMKVSQLSTLLESQRKLCCTGMFANLGHLMVKHQTHPQSIERYWDMQLLRRRGK